MVRSFLLGWWTFSKMDCRDNFTALWVYWKIIVSYTLNRWIVQCVNYLSIILLPKKKVLAVICWCLLCARSSEKWVPSSWSRFINENASLSYISGTWLFFQVSHLSRLRNNLFFPSISQNKLRHLLSPQAVERMEGVSFPTYTQRF